MDQSDRTSAATTASSQDATSRIESRAAAPGDAARIEVLRGELARKCEELLAVAGGEQVEPEEIEAREILDRIERELPGVEERISRLMHQYGLG
jgi:hypothetical protein